ncbi:hypothetical protein ACVMLK_10205 [Teichococcus aerofrigidensis]
MRTALVRALLCLSLMAPLLPAVAAPLRDVASGLGVAPPPGYTAEPIPAQGDQTARFALRRPTDRDTGCQVAYVPAPQNAAMSQEQLNRLMATPRWQELVLATLAPRYTPLRSAPYAHAGIGGLSLVADFRPGQGLPDRAGAVRSLFVIQETPKGRTTLVCLGEKAEFAAREAEFLAVARGITPPR